MDLSYRCNQCSDYELQFVVRNVGIEVNETHRDEYGKRTAGFHALMEKFTTFFGLKLAYSILSASEQLSITLQSIIINIHEVKEMSITKAV